MEESSKIPELSSTFICSQCGSQVEITETTPTHCPDCGAEIAGNLVADPQPTGDIQVIADDEYPADADSVEEEQEELSSLHIRQVAALRRGAYRGRAYCVVSVSGLLFGAVELVMMAIRNIRTGGERLLSAMYVAAAVLALLFSWKLLKRIMELTRELKQPLLTDPADPPDFSTLSDGSQHARYLAEMQEPTIDPKDCGPE